MEERHVVDLVDLVFLGAEGLSELKLNHGGALPDWIYESSQDEIDETFTNVQIRAWSIDHTGRPYFAVTILDNAPRVVKNAARLHHRLLRFQPYKI